MEYQFGLKYSGDSFQGRMNARLLAESVQGFADFAQRAMTAVGGKDVRPYVDVVGLRQGSTELLFGLGLSPSDIAALIASNKEQLSALVSLIQECFTLYKHLQGEEPRKIIKVDRGSVQVENNSGTIIKIDNLTLNVALDPTASKAAASFVKLPLTSGAVKLDITANENKIVTVDNSEASYFRPYRKEEFLTENVADTYVTIVTAVLQGDTSWRFTSGGAAFSAVIEDEDFMRRVEKGEERFGHGDTLFVRLRSTQQRVAGKLKAEFAIEKVLDHKEYEPKQDRFI